jgi:hypothetical protein
MSYFRQLDKIPDRLRGSRSGKVRPRLEQGKDGASRQTSGKPEKSGQTAK